MRTLGLNAALLVAIVFPCCLSQEQQPPAKCDPAAGFDWAFNSRDQSPCDIAAYLGGVCHAGQYIVPALPNATTEYLGPDPQTATPCRCSTVFYSLLSACAACQIRPYLRWSLYSTSCPTVHTNFPEDIPSGTAVPSWAYIDIISSDTFDPNRAKALAGNAPESTGTPKPTGSNTPSALLTPTATPHSDESGGSSNAGAIAGGVVGGVAGLGIIAALVFWFCRRRKSRRGRMDPSFDINTGALSDPTTRIGSPYSLVSSPQPKLYNPSDPSTFPDAGGMQPHAHTSIWQAQPVSQHYRSQSADSSIHPGNASIYSTPSHHRNYSGTAEI